MFWQTRGKDSFQWLELLTEFTSSTDLLLPLANNLWQPPLFIFSMHPSTNIFQASRQRSIREKMSSLLTMNSKKQFAVQMWQKYKILFVCWCNLYEKIRHFRVNWATDFTSLGCRLHRLYFPSLTDELKGADGRRLGTLKESTTCRTRDFSSHTVLTLSSAPNSNVGPASKVLLTVKVLSLGKLLSHGQWGPTAPNKKSVCSAKCLGHSDCVSLLSVNVKPVSN